MLVARDTPADGGMSDSTAAAEGEGLPKMLGEVAERIRAQTTRAL